MSIRSARRSLSFSLACTGDFLTGQRRRSRIFARLRIMLNLRWLIGLVRSKTPSRGASQASGETPGVLAATRYSVWFWGTSFTVRTGLHILTMMIGGYDTLYPASRNVDNHLDDISFEQNICSMPSGALCIVRINGTRVRVYEESMYTCIQVSGLWIFGFTEVYSLTEPGDSWTLDMALCTNL